MARRGSGSPISHFFTLWCVNPSKLAAKPAAKQHDSLAHAVLAERSGISAVLALRLGALLGNGAQLWLDMQTKYDLWQAEANLHDVLKGMRRLDQLAVA